MSPDILAAGLILISAFMHASWNAALKNSPDKLAVMVFIMCFGGLLYGPLLPLVDFPSPDIWAFIVASVIIHLFYQIALTKMHEHNPLTFGYPIARGMGPLLVALISVVFMDEALSHTEMLFILLLVAGIFLTARRPGTGDNYKLVYPLLTGVAIAAYTLVDGVAVKRADDTLSFIVWSGFVASPPLYFYALKTRGRSIGRDAVKAWKVGLPTALIAQIGYAIALYAYRLGSIGEISALRETSILFAALIGYFWLKEPLTRQKIVALLLIFTGSLALAVT